MQGTEAFAERFIRTRSNEDLLSWSSGKDSAWALHVLNRSIPGAGAALLTTVNEAVDRVAMHAVRAMCSRRRRAAAACRSSSCRFRIRARMRSTRRGCAGGRRRGGGRVHARRVRRSVPRGRAPLSSGAAGRHGPRAAVPGLGHSDAALAREMLRAGLRARVACVDTRILDASFVGREFDRICWTICRPASTRAARTASFTPASTPARCSQNRSTSSPAKSSRASRSCGGICNSWQNCHLSGGQTPGLTPSRL